MCLAVVGLRQSFGARRADATPPLVLAIVCAGVILASLDLFIVNVALPQMARDFGAHGLGDLSWVLNAYAIVYASLLVLFGRLSERYPREYGFLLGVAIFVAASGACAAADSVGLLVAFRVVQAAGAALMTPTSLGLILATAPAERRAGSVRAWTAVGGMAAALGPVAGGLLVAVSWRWVFIVNIPIGLIALAIGWLRLPRVAGHDTPSPDPLGAVLVTAGVAALTLGLVDGGGWGWASTRTLATLVGAVVLLGLFGVHTARHRNPLIDRALFASRSFAGASIIALLFSIAFGAMLLSRVLWAQDVWRWSALLTGLSIAPGPVMVPLVALTLTGRLIKRIGPGAVIALGCAFFAGGAIWWALDVGLRPDYVGQMLGGMLLTGIGVGLALPTLMSTGTAALPAHSLATGSAVVNMLRQIGLALGVAVLIAVLGTPHAPHAVLSAYRHGWLVIAGFSILAGIVGLGILTPGRQARGLAPDGLSASVAVPGK